MFVLSQRCEKQKTTIDYNVYCVRFPNRSSKAMVFVNEDSTFDIYLNTLYPEEEQMEALEHELEHLKRDHFYAELKRIEEIECEADRKDPPEKKSLRDTLCGQALRGEIIPLFNSMNALRNFYIAAGVIDERGRAVG